MVNKRKTKHKQLVRLGIWKTPEGNFEYIDPSEKSKSRYNPIRKYERP